MVKNDGLKEQQGDQKELNIDKKVENQVKPILPNKYLINDRSNSFLTDPKEIAAYKAAMLRDLSGNLLLGDFNDEGKYIIDKNINDELLSLPKSVVNQYGDLYLLGTKTKSLINGFTFMIDCEPLPNDVSKKIAYLKIVESYDNRFTKEQFKNNYVIDTFTDNNDALFYLKMKRHFNIVQKPSDDKGVELPPDIAARIAQIKVSLEIYKKNFSDVEEKYYKARIQKLKELNNDDIFIALRKKTLGLKLDPFDPNYFAYLNELLDQVIDEITKNNSALGGQIKALLKDVNIDYIKEKELVNQESIEKAKEEIKKQQLILMQQKAAELAKAKSLGKAKDETPKPMPKKPVVKVSVAKIKPAAVKPKVASKPKPPKVGEKNKNGKSTNNENDSIDRNIYRKHGTQNNKERGSRISKDDINPAYARVLDGGNKAYGEVVSNKSMVYDNIVKQEDSQEFDLK
jgi:hypothetical protein